jgi:hypothetical protein
MVDPAKLRELFVYDPITGDLRWKTARPGGVYEGFLVKTPDSHGYLRVGYRGRKMKAHRVIWAMVTGDHPKGQIDHKNGDRSDNRWCNLREATNGQNVANSTRRRDSKTGVKCVQFRGRHGFLVRVTKDGVKHSFGYHPTLEEAEAAAIAARQQLHGSFAKIQ